MESIVLVMDQVDQAMMRFPEYRLSKGIEIYAPPVVLLLGTVGNLLSFVILMTKSMRTFSTYLYLAVLSLTDILVLYAGLLRAWVGDLSAYDVKNYSDWSCKFINVIGYTVSDYSVWLIIAVTIERYVECSINNNVAFKFTLCKFVGKTSIKL